MIIKYWCDSGANIHSCRKGTFDTKDLSMTDEQWLALTYEDKEEIVKEYAFERLDWGFNED